MQHVSQVAALAVAASGTQSVEFHRQRMFSIAAELDEMRRDPRVTSAQIDEYHKLLAHHREQMESIEAAMKETGL